jgi:hypothetical protein
MEPKSSLQHATATLDDLLNLHPDARTLSMSDGQRRCGYVIIAPSKPRSKAPNWAFDGHERFLGAFPTEKQAWAAVAESYHREVAREAPLAAFAVETNQEAPEPA